MKILWTLQDSGSLHSDQAMVSHWLIVGTILFPLSYVTEDSSAPFNCWGATISYPTFCDIFKSSLPMFSALPARLSLFLFPCTGAETFLCCRETTTKGCEEISLHKETSVISPWHSTSRVLLSGPMTAQWRRTSEYGRIKQSNFALVRVDGKIFLGSWAFHHHK